MNAAQAMQRLRTALADRDATVAMPDQAHDIAEADFVFAVREVVQHYTQDDVLAEMADLLNDAIINPRRVELQSWQDRAKEATDLYYADAEDVLADFPQTPEEARICIHGNRVWFGHECGLCDAAGAYKWAHDDGTPDDLLAAAVRLAKEAAYGDSNDTEIDLLKGALDHALRDLGRDDLVDMDVDEPDTQED